MIQMFIVMKLVEWTDLENVVREWEVTEYEAMTLELLNTEIVCQL